jgi:hypothetical protein
LRSTDKAIDIDSGKIGIFPFKLQSSKR